MSKKFNEIGLNRSEKDCQKDSRLADYIECSRIGVRKWLRVINLCPAICGRRANG